MTMIESDRGILKLSTGAAVSFRIKQLEEMLSGNRSLRKHTEKIERELEKSQ